MNYSLRKKPNSQGYSHKTQKEMVLSKNPGFLSLNQRNIWTGLWTRYRLTLAEYVILSLL